MSSSLRTNMLLLSLVLCCLLCACDSGEYMGALTDDYSTLSSQNYLMSALAC